MKVYEITAPYIIDTPIELTNGDTIYPQVQTHIEPKVVEKKFRFEITTAREIQKGIFYQC